MVDTQLVIDLYESGLSASDIAKKLNCSGETVRKKLRKAGYDLNKLRKKYCPALVVMLRTVGNMRFTDICSLLGMSSQSVNSIIRRAGLADKKRRRDFDLDEIEREYLAGASTYELGEKYGVHHATISKWMKKRGYVRGRGKASSQCLDALVKGHETQRASAIKKLEEKLLRDGNNISLVEFGNHKSKYKCNTCGCVFDRWKDSRGSKVCCPECRREQLTEIRKRNGGKIFEPGGHRARCKRNGVFYDSSITKEYLIERDENTCQICGGLCDITDKRWGHTGPLAPSIDHIIPLVRGGDHTDENTQLAHLVCNISKGDKLISSEVITHAKEQAIAYKCA